MSRYVDLDGLTWDGTPITSKIQEVKTKCGYMSGITTGWLWGDNVPHINLEEHDKKIKAKAIDKFVKFANTMPTVEADDGEIRPMRLEEIAEKLKEQK